LLARRLQSLRKRDGIMTDLGRTGMSYGWRLAIFFCAVLGFGSLTPVSPAFATTDRSGFYAGLRLQGSVANLDDVTTSNVVEPLVGEHSSDIVGGGGGVIGYRWGRFPVRTEMEVGHRVRLDWDFRSSSMPAIGYENNVDSTTVLFNILAEYRNMSAFTPFLGGTLGWARNNSSVDRTNIRFDTTTSQSKTENNFAWGIMLGLDWTITAN
jgi:opacity protein-like surface antigen